MSLGYIGAVLGPPVAGYILDASGYFDIIFGILVAVSLSTALLSVGVTEQRVVK